MSAPDKNPASNSATARSVPRGVRVGGIVLSALAVIVVAAGLITRAAENAQMRKWTDEQAVPTVAVIRPVKDGSAHALVLPGRLEAYSSAPIYARVSGYLKSWKVDIGAPVRAGQLLADIEAPDVEQQLLQAQADLNGAQANATLADATAKRWQSMFDKGAVSRQDVDEKVGDLAAKQAQVRSDQANVERLRTMMGFTRLVAPFDGIVTARNTDVGQLIVASGGEALFVVSSVKRLRVYVNVPQNYAAGIQPGTRAKIAVPEHADRTYNASVEASARAVTAASGTTLMQMSVDNTANELLPGGYAEVRIDMPQNVTTLSIPASALIFDGNGMRVATVGSDGRVHLKNVTIASDEGRTVAIGSGLGADDLVVNSPPDGIADGAEVRIAKPAARS